MNEHDTREQSSNFCETDDQAEKPEQRWQDQPRHLCNERLRLLILGIGLLAMFMGFLLVLVARTVLPLFVVMVVVYLGYRRIDAWLDAHEQP